MSNSKFQNPNVKLMTNDPISKNSWNLNWRLWISFGLWALTFGIIFFYDRNFLNPLIKAIWGTFSKNPSGNSGIWIWSFLSFFLNTTILKASITLAISIPLGHLDVHWRQEAQSQKVLTWSASSSKPKSVYRMTSCGPISIAKANGNPALQFQHW